MCAPIPEPAAEMTVDAPVRFDCKWWLYLWQCGSTALCMLPASAVLNISLLRSATGQGTAAVVAHALIMSTVAWIFVAGQHFRNVSPVASRRGLSARGTFGGHRQLAWDEIRRVRPMRLPGLRYVRLDNGSGGPVWWLPLFLKDRDRFQAVVREYAGAGNLLVRYLDR